MYSALGLLDESVDVANSEEAVVNTAGHRSLMSGRLPPSAPADRTLRETAAGAMMHGGLYFTPDAQTLVHTGNDQKQLSLWDLCTGERTDGGVGERDKEIPTSAVSPDGRLLCLATKAGLVMFELTQRSLSGSGRMPCCDPLWEIAKGTRFAGVAFSRDSRLVAAARGESGRLEIRDARSNNAVKVIDDFPAVYADDGRNCLWFSEEVLAVGGRVGKPNQRQVRLYLVKSDFDVLTTLEAPGQVVHSLAMSPGGTKLAVGMGGDGVAIYSSSYDWSDPPLRLAEIHTGPQDVCSTAFSHDGRFLCAGYHPSNQFAIWDAEAAVCIRAIQTKDHHACAFSPADDLLATGGNIGNGVRVHELLPHKPLAAFSLPGVTEQPLSFACASDTVAVLASGKRLAAMRRSDSHVLWHMDMEDDITAWCCPLALQPAGGQVAVCMKQLKLVSLLDTEIGQKLQKLSCGDDAWIGGIEYSPDGKLLTIWATHTWVYDAATGELVHKIPLAKGGRFFGCAVHPSNSFFVTTGYPGDCLVRDMDSGETLRELPGNESVTLSCEFYNGGERLTYWRSDTKSVQIVAVDGWKELQSFTVRDWSHAFLHMSPGGGEYVLVCKYSSEDFAIVHVESGEEPAWGKCLRALMLPAGHMPGRLEGDSHGESLCWVRPASPMNDRAVATTTNVDAGDDNAVDAAPPLILQAVVNSRLHLIDISAFIRAFNEDGNFSVEQLNRLSDISPDGIPALLERWPHLINLRDGETGDTVLHHCANVDLGVMQMWLSGTEKFSLLPNSKGCSAIHEAAINKRSDCTRELIASLDPKILLDHTPILTADIVEIAARLPAQLDSAIALLEDETNFCLFRPQRRIALLEQRLTDLEVRASPDGLTTSEWPGYFRAGEPADVRCDSVLEVLALSGFVAGPQDGRLSPYAQVYYACKGNGEASLKTLLSTRLMIVSTQFKWEAFARRRLIVIAVFALAHFLLAAGTFVFSTRIVVRRGPIETVMPDALHVALLVSNTKCLYDEVQQMQLAWRHEGVIEYLSFGSVDMMWNLMDLGGIAAVYVACAMHFTSDSYSGHIAHGMQQAGALAILLNSLSLLQVMRPFDGTGPLIKIVTEIIYELRYFLVVIAVLLTGFSCAFAVSMPDNVAFDDGTPYGMGLLSSGVLTSYLAMLGAFDIESDYTNPESTVFFVVFLFLIVVIMLNLLIALMADTFERVTESWVFESRKMRVETIIEQELLMNDSDNADCFPAFLQVLRPMEDVADKWAGVSGQVSAVRDEVGAVKREVDALAAEMKQMKNEMRANQELLMEKREVDALAAEMKEMKAAMKANQERVSRTLTD